MSPTVNIDENPSVTVTESVVDPHPPDRLGFLAEGVIRPTRALLGRFEGSSLTPVRVDFAVDGSETVAVDLEDESSLRLESIDVGVETPDVADVTDVIDSATGDGEGSSDESSGAIAFTVEGTIRDLSEEQVAAIADGSPTLASVTFSVSEAVETDGGSPTDVLLEVGLFGSGVIVRRDGTVEIGTRGATPDVDLL